MSRAVRSGDPVARILVVCTGNICRSPLAAALIAHHAADRLGRDADVRIISAGVHGLTGEPATAEMCAEATTLGLDLSHHRAAVADRQLVADADLVIAMTARQRTQLTRVAPSAKERTFTLKELVRLAETIPVAAADGPLRARLRELVRAAHHARALSASPEDGEDVADPYGGSREAYRRCAAEIDDLVRRLSGWLFGRGDEVAIAAGQARPPGPREPQG